MGLFERIVDRDWVYRKFRDFRDSHRADRDERDGNKASETMEKAKGAVAGEAEFIREAGYVNEEALSAVKTGVQCALIALCVFAAAGAFNASFGYGRVSGNSMNDTFEDGESYFALKKASYGKGDVVIFRYNSEVLIKRVIAEEGDTVSIRDGSVYVNGEKLDEDYALGDPGDMDEITVGENMVFVMGDNRKHSLDSRSFGPVSRDDVIGKVVER